jgi:hypothetical protein
MRAASTENRDHVYRTAPTVLATTLMAAEKTEFIGKASCSECRKWDKVAQWRESGEA